MANTVQLTKNGQPVFPVTDESLVMGLNYRPYDSQNPNGMGYLVLKKNKTFAEQVTEANTIYEIRYDFDLAVNFTMPANCTLRFNGGSIAGGYTLTSNNTVIEAGLFKIFGENITLAGEWNAEAAFPEWFGAIGDGDTDDRLAIQKTLDSFPRTRLSNKSYALKSFTDNENNICLVVPVGKYLIGTNAKRDYLANELIAKEITPSIVVGLYREATIKNLAVIGGVSYDQDLSLLAVKTAGVASMPGDYSPKLKIERVLCDYCYYGFDLQTFLTSLDLCLAGHCYIGFHIHGSIATSGNGTSVFINNCYANRCQSNGYFFQYLSYSSITSCAADYCGEGYDGVSIDMDKHAAYRFNVVYTTGVKSVGAEQCRVALSGKIMKAVSISNFSVLSSVLALGQTALIYITSSDHLELSKIVLQNGLGDGSLFTSKSMWFNHDNMYLEDVILKDKNGDVFEERHIKAANFYTTLNSVIRYTYSTWPLFGTTAQRPQLDYIVSGAFYYNTDLGRIQAHYNGGWKDYDGEASGIRRSGTTSQRPTPTNTGYVYFDTDLSKPVWWNGASWVDATGANV